MGWTVLYIAFGIVALWLLAEVLIQYKARLRWRLLAFAGFLGVVVGTVLPSIVVIGLGIAAFAVGQTFVTLSVRSGFTGGWAIRGVPGAGRGSGSSRRRRGAGKAAAASPSLEVSGLESHDPDTGPLPAAPETLPVPDPVDDYGHAGYSRPDDGTAPLDGTGAGPEHGTGHEYGTTGHEGVPGVPGVPGYESGAPQPGYGGYEGHGGYDGLEEETSVFGQAPGAQPQPYPYGAQGDDQYAGYGDQSGYAGYPEQQPQYAEYDYQNHAAAYPAQYAGSYGEQPGHEDYPAQQPYYPDVPETPPGGVWVPQQRDGAGTLPPADPGAPPGQVPSGYGYGTGYDDPYAAGGETPDPHAQPPHQPQYPQGYYGGGY
ncbi:hypothetical protein [Streptomyces albus]|uniref:hypothetical protein n=1 Tax=Streptomyces albus TaxID=1888 RepID=UPI0034030C33